MQKEMERKINFGANRHTIQSCIDLTSQHQHENTTPQSKDPGQILPWDLCAANVRRHYIEKPFQKLNLTKKKNGDALAASQLKQLQLQIRLIIPKERKGELKYHNQHQNQYRDQHQYQHHN